jgi:hypothetical protein
MDDFFQKYAEINVDVPELPATSAPEVAKMIQVLNLKTFGSPVALSLLESYVRKTTFHMRSDLILVDCNRGHAVLPGRSASQSLCHADNAEWL